MDFSVIRPKPPTKKPADPQPPPPPPPPSVGPPPTPHEIAPPLGPYTEDHLDHAYRMQHLRSIEYTNARTWKMNFGHDPHNYSDNYGDYYYSHRPVRINGSNNYDHHQMLTGPPPSPYLALPPPDNHQAPPLLGLPPPEYHPAPPQIGLHPPDYHQAPPRLGLPQLDYHHGPPQHSLTLPDYHQGRQPVNYYYPPPYHGGFFSDENPNGCMVM